MRQETAAAINGNVSRIHWRSPDNTGCTAMAIRAAISRPLKKYVYKRASAGDWLAVANPCRASATAPVNGIANRVDHRSFSAERLADVTTGGDGEKSAPSRFCGSADCATTLPV